MVVANQLYWTASSTYIQGACGVEKAATDKGYNVDDVKAAFSKVGVSCAGTLPTTAPPAGGDKLEKILSGAKGSETHFDFDNSGTGPVAIKTSGGTGDADLYVKFGAKPTTSSYDHRPYKTGNNEEVNISPSKAGRYYIMLRGYSAYSNVKLLATYTGTGGSGSTCGGKKLCKGTPVTGLAATKGNQLQDYSIEVPSGATNLIIEISGGSGDADIYVKYNAKPTKTSYDHRPYISGNNEKVPVASPKTGNYYIMLNAYSSFSGVTLQASYTSSIGKRHVEKIIL